MKQTDRKDERGENSMSKKTENMVNQEEQKIIKEDNSMNADDETVTSQESQPAPTVEENQENVCEVVQKSIKNSSEKKPSKKELLVLDEERLASVRDADLKVIAELLQEIRNENSREMNYAKTQMRLALFTSFISLFIIIIVAIGVAFIVPRVITLANQADVLLQQADGLMTQAETVMNNLETVTTQLAEADITGMLKDVDSFVATSQESMSEAVKKVSDIDIDSLNKAIKDLGTIVAPLARLLGR